MTALSVSNRKGGTGKTTTAVNLAACLAEFGNSVLLVDTDPQGNATSSLGSPPAGDGGGTMALIVGDAVAGDVTVPGPMEGLEVVPAGPSLVRLDIEIGGTDETGWVDSLRDSLKDAPHDFIVFDTPPAMGVLSVSALAASSKVILPLQCDYFSLEGLTQFGKDLNRLRGELNPGLELAGLVRTMYDERTLLSRHVSEELGRHFGSKVFRTAIPRNVRLAEAPSHGLPVILYDSNCAGAKAYRELTTEFLGMVQ